MGHYASELFDIGIERTPSTTKKKSVKQKAVKRDVKISHTRTFWVFVAEDCLLAYSTKRDAKLSKIAQEGIRQKCGLIVPIEVPLP